jgi:magnesium chelatase subunit I
MSEDVSTQSVPAPEEAQGPPTGIAPVRSLRELLDRVTGRDIRPPAAQEESGLAESLPFPFLALVGQNEMKLALMLALINPAVGGVLLVGPRGTGKTTAVRGLVDLLPQVPRSLCHYGCMPEDVEAGGIDAVCPECAGKYGRGEPLARPDQVRLVELPLNARLEDVIGGLDERASLHERMRLKRGILAQADRNILYVDEANLLQDDVVDALLDAAAQGSYTVRHSTLAATYWSRFLLIGSMNPEEGRLRPQIQDRFGLRLMVSGLTGAAERMEAYRRVRAYQTNRRQLIVQFAVETDLARQEIQEARRLLPQVQLGEEVARQGLALVDRLKIDSLRAEITLFEAARAYAAADARTQVELQDLRRMALMALRLRRSDFMTQYLQQIHNEDTEIEAALQAVEL